MQSYILRLDDLTKDIMLLSLENYKVSLINHNPDDPTTKFLLAKIEEMKKEIFQLLYHAS